MTQPTMPSQDPPGTIRVEPNKAATGEYARFTRRFLKADGPWVMISGMSVVPHSFIDEEADLFLADWPTQTLAEWEAIDHDPMG